MLWNHRAVQKGILRKGFCMRRFFQKIGMAFSRFMYGRNGNDRLCLVLMWVYLALWLVSMVTAALNLEITSIVIWGFQVITLSYWLFRILSKNVTKRRREVERFFGFFRNKKNRFRDRKTHVYRRCPGCKAMLRLPKKKGKHTVCCPACSHRFSVKIRKNGKQPR